MGFNNTRTRKKLFIDPVVQGALLRRLLLHWLYAMLAGTMTLLLMQVFLNGVDKPFSYHLRTLWTNYGLLFVVMTCLFPAFAYDSIRLSHRFAGPVYALRTALRTLAEGGKIPEVNFRRGDYWTELAADLNRLATRIQQIQGESKEVTSASLDASSAEAEPLSTTKA